MFGLDEELKIRQEKSAPIAVAFKAWLDEIDPGVVPKSALGSDRVFAIAVAEVGPLPGSSGNAAR